MPLHAIPGWLLAIHQTSAAPGVPKRPNSAGRIDRCHAGFHLGSPLSKTSNGKFQEKRQGDLQSLDTRQDAWL